LAQAYETYTQSQEEETVEKNVARFLGICSVTGKSLRDGKYVYSEVTAYPYYLEQKKGYGPVRY
jgi:hypothetical protein